jgi:hypothetical protein
MFLLAAILSLLVAIAGWHYLFHSTAARKLGAVENERANLQRVRLRRLCGFFMLVLAACLYIGFRTLDRPELSHRDGAIAMAWLGVAVLLLFLVVVLAILDVRLTNRLRRELKARNARS